MPKSDQQSLLETVPKRLSIGIGGHFGSSFDVELHGAVLTYRHSKPVQNFPPEWDCRSEQIRPTEERWQAFRATLDRLDVWRWRPEYFEPVCDGTSWSAEVVYSDKAVLSHAAIAFRGVTGARFRSPTIARTALSLSSAAWFRS